MKVEENKEIASIKEEISKLKEEVLKLSNLILQMRINSGMKAESENSKEMDKILKSCLDNF